MFGKMVRHRRNGRLVVEETTVVVLGAEMAGLMAARELRHSLGGQ